MGEAFKGIERAEAAVPIESSTDKVLGELPSRKWPGSFVTFLTDRMCVDKVRAFDGVVHMVFVTSLFIRKGLSASLFDHDEALNVIRASDLKNAYCGSKRLGPNRNLVLRRSC